MGTSSKSAASYMTETIATVIGFHRLRCLWAHCLLMTSAISSNLRHNAMPVSTDAESIPSLELPLYQFTLNDALHRDGHRRAHGNCH